MEADRSDTKDDFLGLYIRSDLKEQVRQQAEKQGISPSECVRRQLGHLDDAAEQQAVTTWTRKTPTRRKFLGRRASRGFARF